jgi:hypothetical protein
MTVTAFPKNSQDIDASASPEVQMNENFRSVDHQFVYSVNPDTTTGSTFGYLGGRWGGFSVSAGTLSITLEGSPTPSNYVVVDRQTGTPSVSIVATNWNNTARYARVYRIYTNASAILTVEDHRGGPYGVHGHHTGINWNNQTDNYTLAAKDGGNAVKVTAATGKTVTVPTNASVGLWAKGEPVLVMQGGAGQVTVTGDTGVTIRVRESGSPSPAKAPAGQYAIGVLIPDTETTDIWIWTGDIL